MFQTLILLPQDPETKYLPSGEKQTDLTEFECPLSVNSSRFCSVFQTLIELSKDPEDRYLPSGEKQTE